MTVDSLGDRSPFLRLRLRSSARPVIDKKGRAARSRNSADGTSLWLPKPPRRVRLRVAFLLFVLFVLFRKVLVPLQHFLLGQKTMRGGELGRMVDTLTRTIIFRRTMQKRKERLRALGIHQLPPMKDPINQRGIPNLPQATIVELLIRAAVRKQQLQKADELATNWTSHCRLNRTSLPKQILQADYGSSFRPLLGYDSADVETIHFQLTDMRQLIRQHCPSLLERFDMSPYREEQTFLWALCAVFKYGGYLFGRNVRNISRFWSETDNAECMATGIVMYEVMSVDNASVVELTMLAASPRHPLLGCMIRKVGALDPLARNSIWDPRLFLLNTWEQSTLKAALESDLASAEASSDKIFVDCSQEGHCCNVVLSDSKEKSSTHNAGRPEFMVKFESYTLRQQEADRSRAWQKHRVQVTVTEPPDTPTPKKSAKVPIYQRLRDRNDCQAGWICNRCLKNAFLGTYKSCRLVCRSCYEDTICHDPETPERNEVVIDVVIQERNALSPEETKIPKIIHQTWYDEPTVDRYPQIARLQNSWKNAGWEYRFYTDNAARDFITSNYPSRFLDAFDSIMPGAFKADFFRYLVLLKEGGVYADTDILLDTNLDTFITPEMAFFVPRDIVGDYAGQNFCLWNGMIGSTPGHPFLARAVERLVNNILSRADYHDMERSMCLESGPVSKVWKARALPILLLSGPCLLGQAVNDALGRDSVSAYEPGWLQFAADQGKLVEDDSSSSQIGDALLLCSSKADMGAFRFSDVDRNLMVASTLMKDMTKDPIQQRLEPHSVPPSTPPTENQHIHYSLVEHANDIFGVADVYIDNMVNNEVIRLNVTRIRVDM